jgi:fluoroacetyl-CoA thioesterase
VNAAEARLLSDGVAATATLSVGPDDTAEALGSGDLPVLGTPRLIALMELAARTIAGVGLAGELTTVGVSISIEHLAPSPIGASVTATAVVKQRTERRIDLDLEARDDATGTIIGRGVHRRVTVNRAMFLAGLNL